jgi:hypothetical protein
MNVNHLIGGLFIGGAAFHVLLGGIPTRFGKTIERDEQPVLFWSLIAFCALIGVVEWMELLK